MKVGLIGLVDLKLNFYHDFRQGQFLYAEPGAGWKMFCVNGVAIACVFQKQSHICRENIFHNHIVKSTAVVV